MKRVVKIFCVILVLSMIFVMPVQAQTASNTRASAFFAAYGTDLERVSSTSFRIWFDVDANAALMQELGAYEIILYRSSNQENWTEVKTYAKENYPVMIDKNSYSYINYVTYSNAWSGYYYTACITFYAKNSSGTAMVDVYTEIIRM